MCTAPAGGIALDAADVGNEAVVEGSVTRDGSPLAGAYVRLLDGAGEFAAEVQTSATGGFRFFAAPGEWTLRVLSRSASADVTVTAARGAVARADVAV